MTRDFTYKIYRELLQACLEQGYQLISYQDYLSNPSAYKKIVILRHDVDKWPVNSVNTAVIENQLGVKGSYYFRVVPESFDEECIEKIIGLGHEIGYHYEDLALANGNQVKAIELVEQHLEKLRRLYPVRTMCMHGSPLSKWDNKLLWEKYNYKDFGIMAEPYFDIDFHTFLYITDTGRSWTNQSFNIRDKVNSKYNFGIKSTGDIIELVRAGQLPDRILQNIHPQRWNDNYLKWVREYISQNIKNRVKRLIIITMK